MNKHIKESIILRQRERQYTYVIRHDNKLYCFNDLSLVATYNADTVDVVRISTTGCTVIFKPAKWYLATNLTNLMRKTSVFRNIGKLLYYRPVMQF